MAGPIFAVRLKLAARTAPNTMPNVTRRPKMADECCPACGQVVSAVVLPTPKQLVIFRAVIAHMDANGVAPSYREIARAIGINSIGKIGLHLEGLAARGWIEVRPFNHRYIKVIRRPSPNQKTHRIARKSLRPTKD